MSVLFTLCLLATPAPTAPPLAVARVVREGLPPYEDANRFYRLEGEGFAQLETGNILLLHRRQERRTLAKLQVTQVLPDHALARIAIPGETFPQRGDLAHVQQPLRPLPGLPALESGGPAPAVAALVPAAPTGTAPAPEPGIAAQREALYFLRGESRLTAAGRIKLKGWVQAWGPARRWSLVCTQPWPGESLDLTAARITVLKDELRRLGVTGVATDMLSAEPQGRWPMLYVAADPW